MISVHILELGCVDDGSDLTIQIATPYIENIEFDMISTNGHSFELKSSKKGVRLCHVCRRSGVFTMTQK